MLRVLKYRISTVSFNTGSSYNCPGKSGEYLGVKSINIAGWLILAAGKLNTAGRVWGKGQFILYSSLIEKLCFFLLFIQLSRQISLSSLGILTAVFAFSNISGAFFEFGFNAWVQREAASGANNFQDSVYNILSVKLGSLFLIIPLTFWYFSSYMDEYFLTLILITLTTFLFTINNLFSRILIGYESYHIPFISLIAGRFVFIILIALLWVKVNIDLLLSFYFLSAVIQGLHLIFSLNRHNIFFKFKIDIAVLKNIFSSSFVMGSGLLFVWMYDRMDILLIDKIIGSDFTASYAVAYSFYKIPQLAAAVLLVPLYTSLSKVSLKNNLNDLIDQSIRLLLMFCIVAIPFYFLFSGELIIWIYGVKYSGSIIILNSLVLALPGLLLNNLTGVALNSMRLERLVMYANFKGLLINISINCTLLPLIGISASIIAVIITEYSVFLLQFIHLRNLRKKKKESQG